MPYGYINSAYNGNILKLGSAYMLSYIVQLFQPQFPKPQST